MEEQRQEQNSVFQILVGRPNLGILSKSGKRLYIVTEIRAESQVAISEEWITQWTFRNQISYWGQQNTFPPDMILKIILT